MTREMEALVQKALTVLGDIEHSGSLHDRYDALTAVISAAENRRAEISDGIDRQCRRGKAVT